MKGYVIKMKIEKLILRNFAAINNAMNTNEISIDFSESTNKICLLIGPNGSGKTTLLSLLNPFAGLGNLDVRDGLNLILEDKDGYKEIHISNNNDYYIIKHFYTPHKDKNHSVKSYIMKNGNELNINGNVTSFKEYIKEELGIETDYLKLIRIGSNVTSMIDLSETERKTFMSKLLDEIGIYLTYYKKVNSDLHQLKEMISHNVDKLNRLGIDNKKEIKKQILTLQMELKSEQNRYDEISGLISIYNHEIESIDDKETLKDRLSLSVKKLNKMNSILENKDSLESTNSKYYENKINELEKDIVKYQTQIDSSFILIQNHLTMLNQLQEQLKSYEVQYEKEQKRDKELQDMLEEHRKLSVKIAESEDNLSGFSPEYTKSEFDEFYVFIKNTQQSLDKTYEFGKAPIKKVMELIKDNKNVMQYVNAHIMNIDDSEDTHMLFLRSISKRFNFNSEKIFDNCSNDTCEARQLWSQVRNLLENNQLDDKKKDISFYKDMEYVYQNIRDVLLSFSGYKVMIDKLPLNIKDSFLTDNLYKSISNLERIYNEKEMNNLLSLITEYTDYINLKNNQNIIEKDIDMYSRISNTSYLIEQIENTKHQIEESQDQVSSLKKLISSLQEKIKSDKNTVETFIDLKETFELHDELETNVKKLMDDYNLYSKNKELINQSEIELQKIKISIESINQKIQKMITDLNQYCILKDELDNFNLRYDEMSLTKEALSSKKGMSLYYIKSYLGNTEEITNELLDIAYDGQIYIDNFKITPTEFTIPFYNRGKLIRDVKYASQGEISFLSIALSFGLASQALTKYNIMLLDEIDGPLDTKNREKFIKILENQIDRIGSEQNFLITHNDMFSSYPVDIIDLDFSNTEKEKKYELANYISIQRK